MPLFSGGDAARFDASQKCAHGEVSLFLSLFCIHCTTFSSLQRQALLIML